MAKANPCALASTWTPLEQTVSFLVLPWDHCCGNGRRTRNTQRGPQCQNNLGRIFSSSCARSRSFSSVSGHNILFNFSKSNFVKYNYYVHVRGFASVPAPPLFALPHCDNYLCPGGDCFCHPRPSLRPLRLRGPPSLWVHLMSPSDQPISSQEPIKTVKCVIKGRVQGVFYRDWTVDNAIQVGLKGWVRNRRDGSVEALFSGKPEAVDEMQERCRQGPPDAIVTGFEALPFNDDPGTGFERKPTV